MGAKLGAEDEADNLSAPPLHTTPKPTQRRYARATGIQESRKKIDGLLKRSQYFVITHAFKNMMAVFGIALE